MCLPVLILTGSLDSQFQWTSSMRLFNGYYSYCQAHFMNRNKLLFFLKPDANMKVPETLTMASIYVAVPA